MSQVAIVTGGTGDIGRGVCEALQGSGATVVALDLNPSGAAFADLVIECDVTDPDACAAAVDEVLRQHGGVSTLVNLAQKWSKSSLVDVTDEEMRLVYETGPMATLRMMQLCYPHMKEAGGGAIINCASAAGTQGGITGEGAYAGAKEAIRGLTKHAAVEWGPDNIRANVLCPVATSDPDRWPATVIDKIPLRRMGHPTTDVGATVVFLAGNGGSFMTGRTLFIDGGVGTFR